MDEQAPETHPIQLPHILRNRRSGRLPMVVTMRAYEVYCHINAPQEAMVTGDCRGGFHVSELLAFLYARSFPKEEWAERVREAWNGMNLGDTND